MFVEEKGKHFDPILVDIFFKNLDEFFSIREKYQDIF
jgi:response regulator RpfG family c-di-GMP phosphodiesterase